jgi:hypothetical protein
MEVSETSTYCGTFIVKTKLAHTTRRPVSGDYILKSDAAKISETNNEILSNLEICENLTITSIYVY